MEKELNNIPSAFTSVVRAMFRGNKDRVRWQVVNYEPHVVAVLIKNGVSFTYNRRAGLTFVAPQIYVDHIQTAMVDCGLQDLRIKPLKHITGKNTSQNNKQL